VFLTTIRHKNFGHNPLRIAGIDAGHSFAGAEGESEVRTPSQVFLAGVTLLGLLESAP